jgi:hypothetical protein
MKINLSVIVKFETTNGPRVVHLETPYCRELYASTGLNRLNSLPNFFVAIVSSGCYRARLYQYQHAQLAEPEVR